MSDQDQFDRSLQLEAIDYVEGRLELINDLLRDAREGEVDGQDAVKMLRQHLYGIRSIGSTMSLPVLTAICHRCEDYLDNMPEFDAQSVTDLQKYADRIDEAAGRNFEIPEDEIAKMVRALPGRRDFDVADVEVHSIEIMFVMPHGLATKVMSRELTECGYSIFNVTSAIQALQLVPTMKPDVVFVSNVMPDLSGVDLACAIKAMPRTRDIPVAVVTATPDDPSLAELPKNVPILRKGEKFSDDAAKALVSLGIL